MAAVRTGGAVVFDGQPRRSARGFERAPLVRHPVPVAVVSAVVAALAFVSYPLGAGAVAAAFMAVVLVVLSAADLERRIIPNRIVLPAAAILLVAHVAMTPGDSAEFIVAAIGAGLAFLIPNLINSSLMGMGDVKLAILLGAGLGSGVVGAVMIAFISVFPVALVMLVRGGRAARKAALPFGPFLSLGGLAVLIVPHLIGLG